MQSFQPSKRVGFIDGVFAPFGGLFFLLRQPNTWGLALVPAAVFLVLTLLLSWLGFATIEPWVFAKLTASLHITLAWAIRVLVWLTLLLLAALLGLTLAQPLSGTALEGIVRKQEAALGANPLPELPAWGNFVRSLRVSLATLFLGAILIAALALVGLFVPPLAIITVPLKIILAALMLTWDLVDYPLGLRGHGFRVRLNWMRENFVPALGFGFSITVMLLIPCMQLLVLSIGAAGAARLVLAIERQTPRS